VKDPVLVLFWLWAAYLAGRLAVEAALQLLRVRGLLPAGVSRAAAAPSHVPGHPIERPARRRWTPLPAVLWLAGEAALATVVVGVLWLVLRDVSLNLVPGGVAAAPVDIRRVALAAILGWSLLVINVPVAWRLIDRLLPADSKKVSGGVDPEEMGATIGVLERGLVVALLPGGGPAAVGFVVAAKTLARFKELNKRRFAERYLLGTMASVTVALVSALVAGWIWSQPL
jgi:hypothetical protein